MNVETLNKASELNSTIVRYEKLIADAKTQRCEWIEFNFGNGSNKTVVCPHEESVIQEVRNLLVKRHTEKLDKLKKEFAAL